jgi:F0F1-type ATP synthase assembly protein I
MQQTKGMSNKVYFKKRELLLLKVVVVVIVSIIFIVYQFVLYLMAIVGSVY